MKASTIDPTRRIGIACAAVGLLSSALALGAEAPAAIAAIAGATVARDAVENVTCIPPLLGNRCLGISCLNGCDELIPDVGEMFKTVNVPPTQFTAFGLKSCSINRLNFALELFHQSVGDLRVTLAHQGTSAVLYDPPDLCGATAIDAVWSDRGVGPADACPAAGSGTFLPHQALAAFEGSQLVGVWSLTVEDQLAGNVGQVERWRFAVDATCVLLAPPACVAGPSVLCLGEQDRWKVEARWRDRHGATGSGQAVKLTADTGYLWFFNPENVELVVKVLNGCDLTHHYWVFAAGLTDVEVTLDVTDLRTGIKKTYLNPQREPFQPIQDTGAFATCP